MIKFWGKVDKTGDCWNWTASLNTRGYGQFRLPNTRKNSLAHRFSFELANGPIREGMMVCHSCDNRKCVNPAHLFEGTAKDNMADMDAKGRRVVALHKGEANPNARMDELSVALLKQLKSTFDIKSLEKIFGIKKTQIYRILNNSQWKTA